MLNLVRPASSAPASPAASSPAPAAPGFELSRPDNSALTPAAAVAESVSAFGANGPGGEDLVDTINPLHHLPVIGFLYRKFSGDEIAPAARVAGGALFGGPIGAALGLLGAAIEGGQSANADRSDDTALAQAQSTPRGPGGWIINAARHPGLIDTTPQRASEVQTTRIADNVEAPDDASKLRPRPGGWIVNAAYQLQPPPSAGLDTTA